MMKRVRVKSESKGKKLTLNPKTIRALNEEDLKHVTGGMGGSGRPTSVVPDGESCNG